jgi:hypothetical protein
MQTKRRTDSERVPRRIASENAASYQSDGPGRRLIWHPGNYHARDAGPWTRSVIHFAIGALTVMATDCNEQSVIS